MEKILFHSGASKTTTMVILREVKKDIGYREREIIANLVKVEKNNNVPEGYLQYIFYNSKGDSFQAGKDAYNKWGITN